MDVLEPVWIHLPLSNAQACLVRRINDNSLGLKHIHLDREFHHVGFRGVLSLINAMARNTHITSICVKRVDPLIFDGVAEVLRWTVTTRSVEMWVRNDRAGEHVVRMLTNTGFKHLALLSDMVTDDMGHAIVLALCGNTRLESFAFECNTLGDRAGVSMARLLSLKSLTSLKFTGDLMGDDSGVALACALRTNTTLKSLSVEAGHWADASCRAFIIALEENTTLKHLDVWGVHWTKAALEDLAASLEQSTLRSFAILVNSWVGLNSELSRKLRRREGQH